MRAEIGETEMMVKNRKYASIFEYLEKKRVLSGSNLHGDTLLKNEVFDYF